MVKVVTVVFVIVMVTMWEQWEPRWRLSSCYSGGVCHGQRGSDGRHGSCGCRYPRHGNRGGCQHVNRGGGCGVRVAGEVLWATRPPAG
jgi:hypothetical protein